jgi:hypothetical protein
MTEPELRAAIDSNSRTYLGITGDEFMRLYRANRPVDKPAWAPVAMLARLLDD